MQSGAARIAGRWHSRPRSGRESILVFCDDGKGLLFYFADDCREAPFVDEFVWEAEDGETLRIIWDIRHGMLENNDEFAYTWDDADCEEETYPLMVTGREMEVIQYRITRDRSLHISLGMHRDYEGAFQFGGTSTTFARERLLLQRMAADYREHRGDRPYLPDFGLELTRTGHLREKRTPLRLLLLGAAALLLGMALACWAFLR